MDELKTDLFHCKQGFYWAFFFRDLLPLICDAVVANTTEDSDYWHRVLGSRENSWGNRRKAGVGSFVSLSVMHGSSIWNTPVAHRLTELKIPVSCIFAECDGLVPTHQVLIVTFLYMFLQRHARYFHFLQMQLIFVYFGAGRRTGLQM